MNFKQKVILTISLLLAGTGFALAGDLDSPGAPGSGSGMPTLQGIHDRLDTGADLSVSGSFVEPSAGPGATGVTLNNISSVLPQPDNGGGAVAGNVPCGLTFWGLRANGSWGPQTGTRGCVPDTGQTASYTTTPGEDNDYSIHTPSYTFANSSTVTDNVTGLVWQKEDDNATRTWDAAYTYCWWLSIGGKSGWRLPTKKELSSIVDYGVYEPAINGSYFPNTNSSYYWSSTILESNTTYAWYVSFGNGYVAINTKPNTFYVRCVRGVQ